MKISGFTFVHNAIESGYPVFEAIQAVCDYVDEVVVVDMKSTDNTKELLFDKFFPDIRILDGKWGDQAGETLKQAHSLYKKCSGDIILHFEADEVYDDRLLHTIITLIRNGAEDVAVHRLQIEQNFQRCRWYPELVHRIFPKSSDTVKDGHTTNRFNEAIPLHPENGFLWDITNCFRDNWLNRVRKQAELWHGKDNYIMVPIHMMRDCEVKTAYITERLNEPHWTWEATPFDIPDILKPLVGMTKYEPTV